MAQALPDDLMERGVHRLLNAPLTLKHSGAPIWETAPGFVGSVAHRNLFAEYAEEVDFVAAVALQWWNETLVARKASADEPRHSDSKAWIDRPAGPASYPGLIALVRDYWIACHDLNQRTPETERVPPWTFLLEWLLTGEYTQCVSVLACMPYWPIGLDADGNWV